MDSARILLKNPNPSTGWMEWKNESGSSSAGGRNLDLSRVNGRVKMIPLPDLEGGSLILKSLKIKNFFKREMNKNLSKKN